MDFVQSNIQPTTSLGEVYSAFQTSSKLWRLRQYLFSTLNCLPFIKYICIFCLKGAAAKYKL